MTQRARHDVMALTQARQVRDIQTQAARAELDRLLSSLSIARRELETAEARQAENLDHWSAALAAGSLDIHAARYWPVAVTQSQALVAERKDEVDAAVRAKDAAHETWRVATSRADAVAKPLKRARRRLDQALEERSLAEAADRLLIRGARP